MKPKQLTNQTKGLHAGRLFLCTTMLISLLFTSCKKNAVGIEESGVLAGSKSSATVSVIDPIPALHTEGKWIKDPQGNNVVLRGVNIWETGTWYGKTFQQRVDMLTDANAGWYNRVIRIPVYCPGYINTANRASFLARIKAAVDYCKVKKVYCIVDWHPIEKPQDIVSGQTYTWAQLTSDFWTEVAPVYKDEPHVLYEVYNENSDPNMTWSAWKAYAQPWVNIIKNVAPNKLILVGGPNWAGKISGALSDPIVGSNIVYVGHKYPIHGKEAQWDANVGVVAATYPLFMTEWGYQHVESTGNGFVTYGASTTSDPNNYMGTTSQYGAKMKAWINNMPNVSFTCWVASPNMIESIFDTSWNLRTGEDFAGGFLKTWLTEYRHGNWPGSFLEKEAESSTYTSNVTVVNVTDAPASNGAMHRIDAYNVNDHAQYTINLPAKQVYTVKIRAKRFNTRGKIKLLINGVQVGAEMDQYHATLSDYVTHTFGTTQLPAGNSTFKFVVTGKNASSVSYSFTVDKIDLIPSGPVLP